MVRRSLRIPGENLSVRKFPNPRGSLLSLESRSLFSRGSPRKSRGSKGVPGIQESSGESFNPGAKAVPWIRRESHQSRSPGVPGFPGSREVL